MSLTAHLANMPRRPDATVSEESTLGRSLTVKPNWVATAARRAGKALVMLIGAILVLGVITAFKLWMWWPHGFN